MSRVNSTCRKCKAVCCKWVSISLGGPGASDHAVREWMGARGVIDGSWHVRAKCPNLRFNRCRIYHKRPKACRDHLINGADCLCIQAVNEKHKRRA